MRKYRFLLKSVAVVAAVFMIVAGRAEAVCNNNSAPTVDCLYSDYTSNILDEKHLRLFNGQIAVSPKLDEVFGFRNPLAPPFITTDFEMTMTVDGQKIAPSLYYWKISDFDRGGKDTGYIVQSSLTMAPMGQGFLALVQFNNIEGAEDPDKAMGVKGLGEEKAARVFKLAFTMKGMLKMAGPREWDLWAPLALTPVEVSYNPERRMLSGVNGDGGFFCRTSLENAYFEDGELRAELAVKPMEGKIFHFVCVLGNEHDRERILDWYDGPSEKAMQTFQNTWLRVEDLFKRLPHIRTENKELRKFYDHSATTLLMSKWELPTRFVSSPYFSSGGLDGAALGAWLEDYGKVSGILTLATQEEIQKSIGMMVNMNPRKNGAFEPDTGASVGYRTSGVDYSLMKLVYDYIAVNGDIGFLDKVYAGKSLIDYLNIMVERGVSTGEMPSLQLHEAMSADDMTAYLPLMNARRVWMYRALADLAQAVGKEQQWIDLLRAKADHLSRLVNEKMWNEEAGWYDTISQSGEQVPVYDINIFQMLDTGVVPPRRAASMVAHLNDEEFLYEYGVLGRLPGKGEKAVRMARTGDAPGLVQTLFAAGFTAQAEDVLSRILWWGEKFPYYPELVSAESQSYMDFGRANSIQGAAAAQAVAFGPFGLEISLHGEVSIAPVAMNMAGRLELGGLKVRKNLIELTLFPDRCEVKVAGQKLADAPIGERTVIMPASEFVFEEEDPAKKCFESNGIMKE